MTVYSGATMRQVMDGAAKLLTLELGGTSTLPPKPLKSAVVGVPSDIGANYPMAFISPLSDRPAVHSKNKGLGHLIVDHHYTFMVTLVLGVWEAYNKGSLEAEGPLWVQPLFEAFYRHYQMLGLLPNAAGGTEDLDMGQVVFQPMRLLANKDYYCASCMVTVRAMVPTTLAA